MKVKESLQALCATVATLSVGYMLFYNIEWYETEVTEMFIFSISVLVLLGTLCIIGWLSAIRDKEY